MLQCPARASCFSCSVNIGGWRGSVCRNVRPQRRAGETCTLGGFYVPGGFVPCELQRSDTSGQLCLYRKCPFDTIHIPLCAVRVQWCCGKWAASQTQVPGQAVPSESSRRYGSGCCSFASFASIRSNKAAKARGSVTLLQSKSRSRDVSFFVVREIELSRGSVVPITLELCADFDCFIPPQISPNVPVESVDKRALVQRLDV
jgi:hypothetical protein